MQETQPKADISLAMAASNLAIVDGNASSFGQLPMEGSVAAAIISLSLTTHRTLGGSASTMRSSLRIVVSIVMFIVVVVSTMELLGLLERHYRSAFIVASGLSSLGKPRPWKANRRPPCHPLLLVAINGTFRPQWFLPVV